MMAIDSPPNSWHERLERFRKNYLTPGVIIPALIVFLFFAFLFLEIVYPALRDYTAFYGSSAGTVAKDPVKTATKKEPFVFIGRYSPFAGKHAYIVTPLFDYSLEARVLHVRRYYSNANAAGLIPFDMALGWRNMSDVKTLGRYVVFHHENTWGRYLRVSLKDDWRKIPLDYLHEFETGQHYSNNHVIPADDRVFSSLEKLKAGDIVRLKGFLVNLTRPDAPGWRWNTSRYAREDPGKRSQWGSGGSFDHLTTCDTVFVTEAERVEP